MSSFVVANDEQTSSLDTALQKRLNEINRLEISPEIKKIAHDAQKKARENGDNWDVNKLFDVEVAGTEERKTINGRLTIFISSSMPPKTLQTYAKMSEKLEHTVMVMNGFIGDPNKIKPTMKFISEVLKKDSSCEKENCDKYKAEVQINPILFRQYNIERVPAFIWEPDAKNSYCEDDLTGKHENDITVMEGDADLIYVLNEFYRITKSSDILQIVREYEKG